MPSGVSALSQTTTSASTVTARRTGTPSSPQPGTLAGITTWSPGPLADRRMGRPADGRPEFTAARESHLRG